MSNKFGSDARLVGEATITGLRYCADELFWTALAHTDFIGRVKLLAEHYHAMGGQINPVNENFTELRAWMEANLSPGVCLACIRTVELKRHKNPTVFVDDLLRQLVSLGFTKEEIRLYFGASHIEDLEILFVHCDPSTNFFRTLDKIVANRKLLASLPKTK